MSLQLFCLPYAGGSSVFYYKFRQYINRGIELIPIELKGHGYRMDEGCCQSMPEILEDLYCEIMKRKKSGPYALFGYSFGAHVGFELAHLMKERIKEEPQHIFFAANTPPHVRKEELFFHTLDDEQFLERMRKYGGIPDEILCQKEIIGTFLPIMRTDIRIENEYICSPEFTLLECNLSIIYSKVDNQRNNMCEWKRYTNANCAFYEFSGTHFFILDNFDKVANIINCALLCNEGLPSTYEKGE